MRIIEREEFYLITQPEVSNIYSSSDALMLAIKHGHHGPWNKSV
jgi:hypothetical protein